MNNNAVIFHRVYNRRSSGWSRNNRNL